jgi:hypothetical protein
MFGATIGAGEECIFPIEVQRADSAFDGVGIDLDGAVIEEEAKPDLACEGIADRLRELGFLADERELFPQPRLERLDERSGAFLAAGAAWRKKNRCIFRTIVCSQTLLVVTGEAKIAKGRPLDRSLSVTIVRGA